MGTGEGVADAANLAGSCAKDMYRDTGLSRHGSDYSGVSLGTGGGLRRGGRRRERVRLQETNPQSGVNLLMNVQSSSFCTMAAPPVPHPTPNNYLRFFFPSLPLPPLKRWSP